MPDTLRRTWPQRLTFVFLIVCALVCFATAGALAFGQWVLSQRNLIVVDEPQTSFRPDAEQTRVRMPGEEPSATDIADGETADNATTTTIVLAEPDAANFLVTGADSGACADQLDPTIGDRDDIGERSDTIMIWRVNPVANQLAVLSFPRDLWVTLPGGRKGRINEAYERNDPSRLIDTIQLNFGVPVDHYVQIDFCAFRQLVDAVGGVEIPFTNPARDSASGLAIAEAGCVNLDGDMALAYVRSRKYEYEEPVGSGNWVRDGTSDFGRISRQQDFVRRTLSKVVDEGLYSPDVANALIAANRDYLVTDADLTPRRMLEFANTLRNLEPAATTTYRIESTTEITATGDDVQRPLLRNSNMKAILSVFRGEATIASAPEQTLGTTTTLALATTTTVADDSDNADDAGDTGGTASSVPGSVATTLPEVEATENLAGVTPPREIICN